MHLQVLASGSGGNATLVRAGEVRLLVDAGLTLRELRRRLEIARVPARGIHHVAVTHGHLDHAKSAGAFSKRLGIPLSADASLFAHPSLRRGSEPRAFRPGQPFDVAGPRAVDGQPGESALRVTPVPIPHDAEPTMAFRLEHDSPRGLRRAVVLTDMGEPRPELRHSLGGAHLLLLEFNHDAHMLEHGPYRPALKRRVAGRGGHLSNAQAAEVLQHLIGPELHTLVLAHLSETNNTPGLALDAARTALARLGRSDVRVLVAEQDRVGPELEV